MLSYKGGFRSHQPSSLKRSLSFSLLAALGLSLVPALATADVAAPKVASDPITMFVEARADYVSPHQRRMQMNAAASTMPRKREAESTSSGTPQPHFVTYDFGYGWRYKMTNDAHQMVVQHEHLLERLGGLEPGLDGRFKRFMAMDEDGKIGSDGYRVITRDEARTSLHGAEVRFKLEVLGMNLPAHERSLAPAPPPGQGNSPNYNLYRGRQSANAGIPMDAGSGIMPAPGSTPTAAVQAAPSVRHAPQPQAGVINTPRVSRTAPPVATFPKLEATEPLANVPSGDNAVRVAPRPTTRKAVSVTPLPRIAPSAQPGPAVNLDSRGIVTPQPGAPSIAREAFDVEDIEPPMAGEAASGPVHRATIPKKQPVRRANLPSRDAIQRAEVPGARPAVVSIPSKPRVKPGRSKAPLEADASLPPMPSPPPPPPGFFEASDTRAAAPRVRSAPVVRPAAPAPPTPAVRNGRPAALPVGGNADRLTIPVPMGEPQVWGASEDDKDKGAAIETRDASAKSAAMRVPGHGKKLNGKAKADRVVHADDDPPRAQVVKTVESGPTPPEGYRTKHGERERIAPVFHTRSDDLWNRVGARNGNEALSAH